MKNRTPKKSSTFGGFLFSITFFLIAIGWDLSLRLQYFLNRRKTYENYRKLFYKRCMQGRRMLEFFAGLKFEIDVPEKLPETFIVLSNHQSLADIIIISLAFKNHYMKFVAKSSLKYKTPLISPYLRIGKHAFVSTGDKFKETIEEIQILSRRIKTEKVCPVIFPEGTRSKDGKLGKFHSAAVKLIHRYSDTPFLSVALDGGFNFSNVYSFLNASSRITYRVKALSLHARPDDKTKIKSLLNNVRDEIDNQLKIWRN